MHSRGCLIIKRASYIENTVPGADPRCEDFAKALYGYNWHLFSVTTPADNFLYLIFNLSFTYS
jgi:hypothetical protein